MEDQDQRRSSSNKEDDTQENDKVMTDDSDLEVDDPKTSFPKILPKDLRRRPLHNDETILQEDSNRLNFNEVKGAEKLNTPASSPQLLTSYSLPSLYSAILIIIIVVAYLLYPRSSSSPPNKQLDVKKLMSDLKSEFDGQPLLTYRVIESAIKTASSERHSPGIIVLISSWEAKDTTHGLANRLVELVSEPLSSVLIDAGSSLMTERLKKEIDITIQGNLTEKQVRAVLVRNLDQLPFEAAMIFHSYCDHENAPFKRAVYVMTAFVEEEISPNSDSKQWDVLATKRLRAAWRDSEQDQVASLISRLTVSVAAVVPK